MKSIRRAPAIPATRVDWPRLLLALRRSGLTIDEIVAATGASNGAVHGWIALDAEPRHSTGCALIALHLQRCGTDAPMHPDPTRSPT
jgi:hypothetical protein